MLGGWHQVLGARCMWQGGIFDHCGFVDDTPTTPHQATLLTFLFTHSPTTTRREADSAGPSQGRKTGTSSSVATPGNLPPLPPHHPMGATPPSAGAGFLSASRRGSRDPELLPLHHHPISSSLHNSGVPFLGLPGGGTPPPPGAIAGSAGSGRCLAMPRTRSRSRGLSRQASSAVVGGSSGGSDTDGDDGHSSGGESSEGEEDEDEDELTVMGQRVRGSWEWGAEGREGMVVLRWVAADGAAPAPSMVCQAASIGPESCSKCTAARP